jgi:glycerol kinase
MFLTMCVFFQTTLRLNWALTNIEALKTAMDDNDVMFGTLDSWLLYKLTGKYRLVLSPR